MVEGAVEYPDFVITREMTNSGTSHARDMLQDALHDLVPTLNPRKEISYIKKSGRSSDSLIITYPGTIRLADGTHLQEVDFLSAPKIIVEPGTTDATIAGDIWTQELETGHNTQVNHIRVGQKAFIEGKASSIISYGGTLTIRGKASVGSARTLIRRPHVLAAIDNIRGGDVIVRDNASVSELIAQYAIITDNGKVDKCIACSAFVSPYAGDCANVTSLIAECVQCNGGILDFVKSADTIMTGGIIGTYTDWVKNDSPEWMMLALPDASLANQILQIKNGHIGTLNAPNSLVSATFARGTVAKMIAPEALTCVLPDGKELKLPRTDWPDTPLSPTNSTAFHEKGESPPGSRDNRGRFR